MLERNRNIAPLALISLVFTLAACGAEPDTSVDPDPIHEAFYAGDRADNLGLSAAEERAMLLFVNTATFDELDHVPSCSVRAIDNIIEARVDGPIRSLYELDTVPYVGKATFRALSEYVRTTELAHDLDFWNRIRPEFMQEFDTSQTVVFGGPSGRSRWIRSIKIRGAVGDRVAMRLVPLDGTGLNARIDIEAADDSMRIVENPYGLKEARLPAEGTDWHTGIELGADEHTIAIQNRGEPGQFVFEMRCVGGPCLGTSEQTTPFDYLFRADLRGAAEDMNFGSGGSDDGSVPDSLVDLTGDALRADLRARHEKHHREMTYDQARELVFGLLHNEGGVVTGVYSGIEVETNKVPHSWVMNVEHAWPRSHGEEGAFISDLHHLYPTVSWVNSARANYAYCELARYVGWRGEAHWGYDADGSYCFEPRDEFKGNAARSLFYISAAYGLRIDPVQEGVLRAWHIADPVDVAESDRNDAVAQLQGSRNLFVDFPEFVDRIDDF